MANMTKDQQSKVEHFDWVLSDKEIKLLVEEKISPDDLRWWHYQLDI